MLISTERPLARLGFEDDLYVAVGVAGIEWRGLHVAEDFRLGVVDEKHAHVDEMGAAVVEHAAAVALHCLPVPAAAEAAVVDADLDDASEDAGGDHLAYFDEVGGVAQILMDGEDLAGLLGDGEHGVGAGEVAGHGFLDDDVLSGAHGRDRLFGMEVAGGGDHHELDGFVGDQLLVCGVGEAVEAFDGFGLAVGVGVADGDDAELVGEMGTGVGVVVPAGAAEAGDGNVDGCLVCHF